MPRKSALREHKTFIFERLEAGYSYKEVAESLTQMGCSITASSVHSWVKNHKKLLDKINDLKEGGSQGASNHQVVHIQATTVSVQARSSDEQPPGPVQTPAMSQSRATGLPMADQVAPAQATAGKKAALEQGYKPKKVEFNFGPNAEVHFKNRTDV